MTAPRLLRFLAAGLAAVVVLWLASLLLVLYAGAVPSVRRADAILVLGAAQYNGRPSPVFRARIDHGLDLYRRGLARRVIFTGGVGKGDTLSEAEVARRYALAQGVPDSVVLVERRGETSAQSVVAAASLMHAHQLASALIVSDSYHMLRLELLARRAGIYTRRAPTPGAPIDQDRRLRWKYLLSESIYFPATALLGGR